MRNGLYPLGNHGNRRTRTTEPGGDGDTSVDPPFKWLGGDADAGSLERRLRLNVWEDDAAVVHQVAQNDRRQARRTKAVTDGALVLVHARPGRIVNASDSTLDRVQLDRIVDGRSSRMRVNQIDGSILNDLTQHVFEHSTTWVAGRQVG